MQKQPTSQKDQKSKKGLLILILLIIALLLCCIGTSSYWLLTRKDREETQSQKQSCLYNDQTYNDGDSFNSDDGCNTCSCENGEVACTLMACDDGGNGPDPEVGPYEGWKIYQDKDNRISFKYPSEWNLSESEYNPLSYTITIASESGHSIVFYSAAGDYGNYCIYSDTDTSNMPEDYNMGIIGKKELSSYEEFSNNSKKYRRSPTGDQENEELICIYDEQSRFYISYIPNAGIVNYIIPYGGDDLDLANLDLILFSLD